MLRTLFIQVLIPQIPQIRIVIKSKVVSRICFNHNIRYFLLYYGIQFKQNLSF